MHGSVLWKQIVDYIKDVASKTASSREEVFEKEYRKVKSKQLNSYSALYKLFIAKALRYPGRKKQVIQKRSTELCRGGK